jgi:Tol biopolymer transport system component
VIVPKEVPVKPLPLALAILLLGPGLLSAQRKTVLPQIELPHNYYYREMYLPQAETGPTSPAFSPDGKTLVFSWQGSLWRQALDSTEAVQLTSGPGYDYQPDWSPDGTSVVYASYSGGSIELFLLDLRTLASRPLTRNGAVNVEPHFSPDGQRVAFVSTLFKGRFHIFVLDLRSPEAPVRLTEDAKSTLPRYYYSAFDHYLSPSWSPDGREILFVSNRGAVWGTGGFWRMRAEPGSTPREIHDEETNWKARPHWVGGRVVYASYLGRAWHQVWVMTDEGQGAFPLTYGEFDAKEPRLSPDGSRVAYTSNEGGTSALYTLSLPGGQRTRLEARSRVWLRDMARLRVRILEDGREVPARLSVIGEGGRSYAPDGAWRHADDGFDPRERTMEYGYFHSPGKANLDLPTGSYTVECLHGLEYQPLSERVALAKGDEREVVFHLKRLDDPPSRGWWSGDLHVHMNYGGAYRNTPEHLVFQARAEDLHVVEGLIVNKEQRFPDLPYFRHGLPEPASEPGTLLVFGQEFHTSYWGHLGLLGLKDHVLIPGYAAYAYTPARSPYPTNATILELAHAQGGLGGYVHPFDDYPDPAKRDTPLTNELPVDVALGLVDYYEVVGFSDHLQTARVWYQLLNCGFRIPAGAGTDAMANFASLRGPVGMNRVYAKTGKAPDHAAFLEAIRNGRTFATNGPLLSFSLGGKETGDTLALPQGSTQLPVTLSVRSLVGLDHLEIVSMGRVVRSIPLSPGGRSADWSGTIDVTGSAWFTLRAYAEKSAQPVLDIYPFASTSPVYVTVGGEPIRSAEDARYFLAWIGRLEDATKVQPDYESDAERKKVLDLLARARGVFLERAGGR